MPATTLRPPSDLPGTPNDCPRLALLRFTPPAMHVSRTGSGFSITMHLLVIRTTHHAIASSLMFRRRRRNLSAHGEQHEPRCVRDSKAARHLAISRTLKVAPRAG